MSVGLGRVSSLRCCIWLNGPLPVERLLDGEQKMISTDVSLFHVRSQGRAATSKSRRLDRCGGPRPEGGDGVDPRLLGMYAVLRGGETVQDEKRDDT